MNIGQVLKARVRYFGSGPIAVSLLLAVVLTGALRSILPAHQSYPDPVVGAIAWDNLDKSMDGLTLAIFVAGFGIIALVTTMLCNDVSLASSDLDVKVAVNQYLLLSLVPAAWRIAMTCASGKSEIPPLRFLSLFPLGAVATVALLRRYRTGLRADDVLQIGGAALVGPLMAGCSAIGILITILRLLPTSLSHVPQIAFDTVFGCGAIATVSIFILGLVCAGIGSFRQGAFRVLRCSQYLVPLLLMYLVPPPMLDTTHQFRIIFPTALVLTISGAIVFCMWRMIRRFSQGDELRFSVAPASVAGICILMMCGTTQLPMLPADFFHTGEQMIPWQQLWEFHRIPYVDFVPIHGAMSLLRGMMNGLFFSGTGETYQSAEILLTGLATMTTVVIASELISPVGSLFFSLTALPSLDRMYLVAPSLFVIAIPRLLQKPVKWLAVWWITAIVACAYNAALGPAFVLGTIPIAAWQVVRGWHQERKSLLTVFLVVLAIAAVVLVIPITKAITLGYVRFIIDNHWTNEAANGIAWSQGAWQRNRSFGIGSSQLLWEIVRIGWLPLALSASVYVWKQFNKPVSERNLPAMVLGAAVPPVLLLSCVWVIERIEPMSLGRSGAMTDVALFYVLPAAGILLASRKHIGRVMVAIAALVGAVIQTGPPAGWDPEIFIQKTFTARLIPSDAKMIDGASLGLAHVGQVIRNQDDSIEKVAQLKRDLEQILRPEETYFDLSNETALYFYLDKPAPAQYAAYVAANGRLQQEMIKSLDRQEPPVVLIDPAGRLDNAPQSLRCYRLYRKYVLKFAAVKKGPFTLLVDPTRIPGASAIGGEEQLKLLDNTFSKPNLLRLPIAWGNSLQQIRETLESASQLDSAKSASGEGQTWQLPLAERAGSQTDFIRLHVEFTPAIPALYKQIILQPTLSDPRGPEPDLSLSWSTSNEAAAVTIHFKGQTGDLLVPVGSYPRWLLARDLQNISVKLNNPRCASRFTVAKIELLKIRDGR